MVVSQYSLCLMLNLLGCARTPIEALDVGLHSDMDPLLGVLWLQPRACALKRPTETTHQVHRSVHSKALDPISNLAHTLRYRPLLHIPLYNPDRHEYL